MASREEDILVIGLQYLRQIHNYSAKRFLREFPYGGWKLGGLKALTRKIDKTVSCVRRADSGRPSTARANEKIASYRVCGGRRRTF